VSIAIPYKCAVTDICRICSFEDLLCSLQTVSKKYPDINIKPIRSLRNIVLHPFHLVNVMQRRHHFGQNPQQNNDQALSDPSSKPEVQEALKWLAQVSIRGTAFSCYG
jgi:hypothetical protein